MRYVGRYKIILYNIINTIHKCECILLTIIIIFIYLLCII